MWQGGALGLAILVWAATTPLDRAEAFRDELPVIDLAAPEIAERVAFAVADLPPAGARGTDAGGLPPQGMEVLRLFLGRWRTETRIHNMGPPPRDIQTRGRAVCLQTLEDRYFEFRSTSITPPGEAELQIMTYDADANRYLQWVFDSDGYRHEAVGRWDPTSTTITWEGQAADGSSFVIRDHWVSRDRLEWALERKAADGRIIQTIEGVVSRDR
jgi:hypothetical protein